MNLKLYVEILQKASIENPWREARRLAAHVGHCSYEDILLGNIEFSSQKMEELAVCIQRRAEHEPFSKIVGYAEFWKYMFYTTADTLDPRPESELFIEYVLKYYPDQMAKLSFLDLGTGTGCLLLSCLAEYPQAQGVGVDQSEKALIVAQKNAERFRLQDRSSFFKSFWNKSVKGVFDVVLCNPPYIEKDAILEPDVMFDPAEALFAGPDGLQAYRAIFETLDSSVHSDSRIFIEVGFHQDQALIVIAQAYHFFLLEKINDWQKIPRLLIFQKNPSF